MANLFSQNFSIIINNIKLIFTIEFDENFVYKIKIINESSQNFSALKMQNDIDSKINTTAQNVFLNAKNEIENYLNAKSKALNIPYKINENLSNLAKNVLKNLQKIPYGETISYKNLALLSNTNAIRAVGSVMAKNELMLIFPCHRVVSSAFKILKNVQSKRATNDIFKNDIFKNVGNFCGNNDEDMVDIKRFLLELEFKNTFI